MKANRPPAASIRHVARLAGVSIATVSRALATPDKVAERTLQRVLEQVKRSRYRPNLLARNFRSKRAYSIVVLVPNIANPFFAEVIRGIEQVAQQHGYAVLLGDTEGRDDRERYYVSLVETRQADGIIQLRARIPEVSHGATDVALVNACECAEGAPYPQVRIDNAAAARTMTEHLLGLGHRRIGVILGPDDSPLTRERLRGHRAALRAAKVPFDETLLAPGNFTMSSGHAAAETLLQLRKRPTALFCFNDEMAMGAMQRLKRAGLRVPQDVSVAGFDDIEFATFCDPPLTTIQQPSREIGNRAMSLLLAMLKGDARQASVDLLPARLVVRESTAPRKRMPDSG